MCKIHVSIIINLIDTIPCFQMIPKTTYNPYPESVHAATLVRQVAIVNILKNHYWCDWQRLVSFDSCFVNVGNDWKCFAKSSNVVDRWDLIGIYFVSTCVNSPNAYRFYWLIDLAHKILNRLVSLGEKLYSRPQKKNFKFSIANYSFQFQTTKKI